ncbi:histidine kinase [Hymenobacter sp. RP-2-7]|uniref:Histidine kinase n=1 Tax=Hymenobacter polaris TaxID=2682546 RepID=A0A7Y0AET1_9BACT|nr:histidine kinase [Hymenobacter polaris]NML66025.1 histidine kinase [Hymenobacter polaris]
MNRRRIVLYQVLGWVLIISYRLFSMAIGVGAKQRVLPPKLLLHQFVFELSIVALFYYCYLLFPIGLRRGRWPVLVLGLLGTPLIFAGTRYLLDEVLLRLLLGSGNYYPDPTLLYYLQDNLYFLLPTIVLAGAAVLVRDAFVREQVQQNQLQLQAMEQAKTQAELAFLRTQINPHFLYNTLNYLYATAYPLSEALAEAVLRLSELMRYLLHESPDGQVDLAREVEYLNNYLALYRLRFEDKCFVQFEHPAALGAWRVAALLLIPLVENALKHGVINRPDCPVTIVLALPAPTQLRFTVCNRIGQQQKDATTGVGLPNIRRRLALLYPGRHALRVHDDGQTYRTELELSL